MTGSVKAERTAHVRTLRDLVFVLSQGLSRLPADAKIHKAQRAALVLERALEDLEKSS